MPDLRDLFERQAVWQRSLRELPWPEKMRLALLLRAAAIALRRTAVVSPASPGSNDPMKRSGA